MIFDLLTKLLTSYLGWALTISFVFFALTKFALDLLADTHKRTLSLWLTGSGADTWSQSFCRMFDALFGERYLSVKCITRSILASLISVMVLWLLLDGSGVLSRRAQDSPGFWQIMAIGAAINLVADYISLLETRYLLGQIHRFNGFIEQLLVLIIDVILSALIILGTIWLYQLSPLYVGESSTLAEMIGAFSIYAVFFYSTFLTSLWTWGYILSTWFLRLFTDLGLGKILDIEKRPTLMIATVGSIFVFIAVLLVSLSLKTGKNGVSYADEALCWSLPGKVCNAVARLTNDEQEKLKFMMLACEGGITRQCLGQGMVKYKIDPKLGAKLFRASCDGGNAEGCNNLGFMYHKGHGIPADLVQAAALYRLGCDGGDADGCYNAGWMFENVQDSGVDSPSAVAAYRRACELGDEEGCKAAARLRKE